MSDEVDFVIRPACEGDRPALLRKAVELARQDGCLPGPLPVGGQFYVAVVLAGFTKIPRSANSSPWGR
jgi:hypothetical protein